MANTITFCGKIRKIKENGYEEKEFGGGLIRRRLRFQAICGDSVQWLEATSLIWKDEPKNKIITYKTVENGKDERIEIAWNERFNEDIINSVAGYRRYLIDTDTYSHRKEIENSGDASEIEKSRKKRKEFLHSSDFIDYLIKVLDNEKSRDMIFKITGTVEFSYNPEKDIFYRNFVPQKIYRVDDNTDQNCFGTTKLYFTSDAVEENDEDFIINAYAQYYNTTIKSNSFVPFPVKIAKDHPKAKGFKMLFNKAEDGEVKELGVNVDFINGGKRVEITEDMLSEEQQELLSLGMITLDDIKSELGSTIIGDRVTETRLTGIAKGYTKGCSDTVYSPENLIEKPIKHEEVNEEVVDIFDEDDDI